MPEEIPADSVCIWTEGHYLGVAATFMTHNPGKIPVSANTRHRTEHHNTPLPFNHCCTMRSTLGPLLNSTAKDLLGKFARQELRPTEPTENGELPYIAMIHYTSLAAMMLGFERLMKPDVAEELGLGEVMDKYCTIMLPEGKTQEEVLVDMILGFRAADVAQPPQPETSSLHAEHSGEPEGQVGAWMEDPPQVRDQIEDALDDITTEQAKIQEMVAEQLKAAQQQLQHLDGRLHVEKLRDEVRAHTDRIHLPVLPKIPEPGVISPENMPPNVPVQALNWLDSLGESMAGMDLYIQAEVDYWRAVDRVKAAELAVLQPGEAPSAAAGSSPPRPVSESHDG
ncbi:uncharacterized protein B0H18DRAFT_955252 [Fomitopsis serialis]|uniref:uncharacterized protein n=1 Tax=Fomitopsis serialis TaxID=139415 RepID=UPI002008CDD4|nr:uncharacterized protein B0H18DRAFT_955252 [Neoantrodia serialis]KAH9925207.1 hypothetical protein B0H18DRAFT_955252 [Neoantrodia serialis]